MADWKSRGRDKKRRLVAAHDAWRMTHDAWLMTNLPIGRGPQMTQMTQMGNAITEGHRGTQRCTEYGVTEKVRKDGMGTGRAPDGSAVVLGKWEWGARHAMAWLSSPHFQRQHARRVSPRPHFLTSVYLCAPLWLHHLLRVFVGFVVNPLETGEIAKQSHR